MTASGINHVQTPIAGVVGLALRDPSLQKVADRAADKPADLTMVGPASARVYAASALASAGPLLVVTATGREADDLTAELHARLSALLDEAQSAYPDKPSGPADSWWLPAHLGGTAPEPRQA